MKKKVQVFESKWNAFASIWFFFKHPNVWCGEHSNMIFLVNGVCFHNENHPQPFESDIIVGDTFSNPNDDTNVFEILEEG